MRLDRIGSSGVGLALLAAVLFGASTPAAKGLLGGATPQLLAGLLYLGSGSGLLLVWVLRHRRRPDGAGTSPFDGWTRADPPPRSWALGAACAA